MVNNMCKHNAKPAPELSVTRPDVINIHKEAIKLLPKIDKIWVLEREIDEFQNVFMGKLYLHTAFTKPSSVMQDRLQRLDREERALAKKEERAPKSKFDVVNNNRAVWDYYTGHLKQFTGLSPFKILLERAQQYVGVRFSIATNYE